MASFQIQCVQCEALLSAESAYDLEHLMVTQEWEPYGIRVSIGVAAAEHQDTYSCHRCATETPHQRLSRLIDAALLEAFTEVPYDIIAGGSFDTVILLRGRDMRIPVVFTRRDADLADSIAAGVGGH